MTISLRRTLTPGVLAGALFAAVLGFAADPALGAYKAKLDAGTLTITGDAANDVFVLYPQPGSPSLLQLDVGGDGTADATFDRSTFTAIDVKGGGGDDELRIAASGAVLDEAVTLNGGAGNDTIVGGLGPETLIGGGGDDTVTGSRGDDTAQLGSGADSFDWHPGDGSDTVDGDGGQDVLDFFGASIGESFTLSADGARARFTRNVANIAMDLGAVERVNVHALSGTDALTVDDLDGTSVKTVDADLNAGGGAGADGQADTVLVRGTDGPDRVALSSPGGFQIVDGLSAEVIVEGAESALDDVNVATLGGEDTILTGREVFGPASMNVDGGDGADVVRYSGTSIDDAIDVFANGAEVSTVAPLATRLDTTAVESLVVLGLGGTDTMSAVGNLAALTSLTLDGGDDADVIRGGNGADLLLGGKGDDRVDGNGGADRVLLGAGDDTFEWTPGDGNDVAEGQSGSDLVDFFGSSIGEAITLSAFGERLQITRNIASVTTDADGFESVLVHAFAGSDTTTVDDMRGTDVKDVAIDLRSSIGTGDGVPDTVAVNGSPRRDRVDVRPEGSDVLVSGLAATTRIVGSEFGIDTLQLHTGAGDDVVTIDPAVELLITPLIDLGTDE